MAPCCSATCRQMSGRMASCSSSGHTLLPMHFQVLNAQLNMALRLILIGSHLAPRQAYAWWHDMSSTRSPGPGLPRIRATHKPQSSRPTCTALIWFVKASAIFCCSAACCACRSCIAASAVAACSAAAAAESCCPMIDCSNATTLACPAAMSARPALIRDGKVVSTARACRQASTQVGV